MIDDNNKKALEDFLLDIDILDELNTKFTHFNVFNMLGIVNAEIRHSNVLAWLLNPKENHGFGDVFIKKFIQQVFSHNEEVLKATNNSLLKISLMDYDDFTVRREWKNIDILAVSEQNELVLIIENKVWSKESEHQLKKYLDIVSDEFRNYTKINVFLTPDGDTPSDEENWAIIDYNIVVDVLTKSISLRQETISDSVKYFLDQYVAILRRYIVGDNELQKICREIYYKHQNALDLIFEFKPDIYSDISIGLEAKIDAHPDLVKDICSKTYVRFTTKKLDNAIPKEGKEWTASKRFLIFEIQNKNEKIVMKIIIGPSDNEKFRQKLYGIAGKWPDYFKGGSPAYTPKFTQIYSKEIMAKNYIEKHNSDLDTIQAELDKKFSKLLQDEIFKMEELILHNL